MSLTLLQRGLLLVIYVVLIISLVLSIQATKNIGQTGFDKCMEKECEEGEENCNKFRTIDNCCNGAGGETGVSNNKYICKFN
ncbi:MAG: hypothetical protein KJ601_00905 [Nanoarchaeota archaeon]|nr:hypothetical protein [Nanoarchaeota archaeon]MBU1704616.1 hypothetical protein [Nanoarchaeota archaeon]